MVFSVTVFATILMSFSLSFSMLALNWAAEVFCWHSSETASSSFFLLTEFAYSKFWWWDFTEFIVAHFDLCLVHIRQNLGTILSRQNYNPSMYVFQKISNSSEFLENFFFSLLTFFSIQLNYWDLDGTEIKLILAKRVTK